MKRFVVIFALLALPVGVAGCERALGPSKVAHGQLYQAGDGRYDGFFQAVHEQQVAGANRIEDRRRTHRPIVTALSLTPDAKNDDIVRAVRERRDKHVSTPDAAIDETNRAELDRAKKLRAASVRCEELVQQGRAHEAEQKREWDDRGAERADEKKTEKRQQLRRELGAAVDALETLARESKREAKEADAFVDALAGAVGKEVVRDATSPDDKKDPKKPDAPKPKVQDAQPKRPKPTPTPDAQKPTPDAPKPPAPAPSKPPDEVFNP